MRTGGAAGAASLVGLVPPKLVNQIAYTGRLTAEQLAHVGAINEVVPAEELLASALRLAADVARVHPASLSAYKKAYVQRLADQRLGEFAAAFDDIRDSHGNDDDNTFWARAAQKGVKDALGWRDEEFGPRSTGAAQVGEGGS